MNQKVLIAMDSFKGTFSSYEINNLVKEELLNNNPSLEIECINIADGGEGSVEAILPAIHGTFIRKEVTGPYLEQIDSYYGIGSLNGRSVAIIEVASVVGFQHKKIDNDPGKVTTFGIGELIKDALDKQVDDIYLCLGGSISNDAGSGIASALGVEFFNQEGEPFLPMGKTLSTIKSINIKNIDPRLSKTNLYCLCDVINPFFGPKGAAFVFAKQKGASLQDLPILDQELKAYHQACVKSIGIPLHLDETEGAGAAGGICYSLIAFFHAKILSGIETILALNKINEKIINADTVITGEGKLDSQSFDGKVISQVKRVCMEHAKRLIGVFGSTEIDQDDYMELVPLFSFEELKTIKKEDFKSYLLENTPKQIKEKIKNLNI